MSPRVKERLITFLRSTERYTKTDMVYLFFGGAWLSAPYLVGSVSAFILSIVLANTLLPATYGAYKYVLSVANLIGVLTLPGLDTSLVRSVARGLEGSVYQVMSARIKFGLLAGGVTFFISAYYLFHHNPVLAGGFAVMAVFIPFMDTAASWADLLAGRKTFRTSANIGVVVRITGTLVLIGTSVFFPSLIPMSLAYFGGWTIIRSAALAYTFMRYPPNTVRDAEVIPYGKHLTIMKGISTVAGSIGSIMLFHVGAVALAVYAIAIAPIEQARGLLGLLQTLALPRFSQDEWRTWTPGAFFRKVWPLLLLLLTGVSCYALAAPYLYAALFPKYLAAIPYTQVWAFSLLITVLLTLLSTILQAKQEVRKLYVFNVMSVGATFVLTPVGTYFYGIWGLLGAQALVKSIETGTLIYLVWMKRLTANAA